jgi:hypothetical protein
MWNLLKGRKSDKGCAIVRDALENTLDTSALSAAEREHLAGCSDCQATADDIAVTRSVLGEVSVRATEPGPWFAPRVMAAIGVRESELRQSLEAWAAVPRLAARLTWLSALALLLASSWLYQLPKSTPSSGNGSAVESLFDSPQASGAPDDVIIVESAQ